MKYTFIVHDYFLFEAQICTEIDLQCIIEERVSVLKGLHFGLVEVLITQLTSSILK